MVTEDVYTQLAERLNCPGSDILLKVLRKLMTPDEGRLLLALPAEPAELARIAGLGEDEIGRKLQEFLERGLVIPTSKGPRLARDVTQLHDSTLSSADKWVDEELLDLWRDFHEVEWVQNKTSALDEGYVQSVVVLPARKAINMSPRLSPADLLAEEDVRELIKGAEDIAVVPCSCRRSMRRCDKPLEVCLQFNKGARYALDRGAGRRLSVEEAIVVANRAEEAGLVHTWPARASGRLNEICNCCSDCCVIFDSGLRTGTIARTLTKSRFRAEVDAELCTGCQDCVERCFFDAIELEESAVTRRPSVAVDEEKCFGCGLCVLVCEAGALAMRLA